MLKKLLLISLILSILPLVYAVEMNDTLVYNTVTNYSFYVNSTIYFDILNVTDEGRIQIYGIISNSTNVPILFNINSTLSIIDLYNLSNALITYSNNSVVCPNVIDCTGNKNVSIPSGSFIKIYNNYIIETGTTPSDPRPDDPISKGTSGTGTNQSTILNTSLTSPVTLNISGLTNALIFNNSNNVLASTNINDNDGEINLTIRGDETIYILNNYEKSESYTRYLDPIWFSSSSSTSKTISSNLTDSINVSVIINTNDCSTFNKLTYFNGTYTDIPYSCSSGVVTSTVYLSSGSSYLTTGSGDLIVDYTYIFSQADQYYIPGSLAIIGGLIGMTVNFFTLSPVLGTIMGVLILISGLVILVIYLRKWSNSGENDSLRG